MTNRKIVMSVLFLLLVFMKTTHQGGISPCPSYNKFGSVVSAHLSVSNQNSLILLQSGQNSVCYNYSLPYQFNRPPSVAVAVDGFSSQRTDDLFFTIKPVYSQSLISIPFIVRTHWFYTRWTKISFSFIAEDRTDIESGYYQIDTGNLGSCEHDKSIYVLMPWRQISTYHQINHNVFLNGFQISTQSAGGYQKSPYEVSIINTSANITGIAIYFQVTTITQVHGIHVSYIAFEKTDLNIKLGSYVYEETPSLHLAHTPVEYIGRNYARIHGITGFLINNIGQQIEFQSVWDGTKFNFDFQNNAAAVKYFSYQHLFITGSECQNCKGYQIQYEGKCVNSCPAGTFETHQKTCISCGQGYYWNGTNCMKSCPFGQYLDPITNQCICPAGMNWTGKACIKCGQGRVFDEQTKACICPPNQIWNGYTCSVRIICTQGKQWNIFTYSCECPVGTVWNGTYCLTKKICYGGRYLDKNNQCVCPEQKYWNGNYCQGTGCIGGQKWNGTHCVCKPGLNFNGQYCIECINGQIWDYTKKSCQCQYGWAWNGNFCQKKNICSGGRVWNPTYKQCWCDYGYVWNGAQCIVKPNCCCGKRWNQKTFQCDCPQGFKWDGHTCLQCTNGKSWHQATRTCICPPGTQWNSNFCAVIQNCYGGMMWNQNTWACQCPSYTVWNNNYCIANPCINGQVWDNNRKACVCPSGKILINSTCLPPQVSCVGGQVWDQKTYSCKCNHGYWFDGENCIPVTVCQNNQFYNPLNNKCQCQTGLIWLASKNICGDPTCPEGQMWNGYECNNISCPPNSFYNGTQCVCKKHGEYCKPWEYFDGQNCVYYPNKCPHGTQWKRNKCVPVSKGCQQGYYPSQKGCNLLPQLCPSTCLWSDITETCNCQNNGCPPGTYKTGNRCLPYVPCSNGQIWQQTRFLCVCPQNTEWNGKQCLPCSGGKKWVLNSGCQCPEGQFSLGSLCQTPDNLRCRNIPNSQWNGHKCKCKQGYSVIGMQCICEGVVIEGVCNRCAHLPNSQWIYNMCQCKKGYIKINNKCVPKDQTPKNEDDPENCNVGTYFDNQQKKCLACPDGCLSCSDCYTCKQCRPQFNFDPRSKLCVEHCGDGKKFILQCDDGNNIDGDGCSMDCKTERGYNCRGGSPDSKDNCLVYEPPFVTLSQTGQIRYSSKIILNIKADYLPKDLMQSIDCSDRCSNVLTAKIISGDQEYLSIKSAYVPGTSYSFSLQIDFGRSYIGKFKIQIGINQNLANKYFRKVSCKQKLQIDVNPAYLATVSGNREALV